MHLPVAAALSLIALPTTLACVYLLLLTLLSGALPRPPRSSRRLRFDVIVPAHDEAPGIAHTVANLRALDWPADRFRVLVVADNCSDATAALARGAGAEVIERKEPSRRGKGYALELAFRTSRAQGQADAVVVVDADTEVSPNLLEACAARIECGASAVQVHYGVLNPRASWRTRLATIAGGAFHILRSRARERLGLSCGLRGNGWCVTHRLLERVPYRAFSLAEDVEFGIMLGLAGYRVHYADEAHANAEMASRSSVSLRQRRRWEDGRIQLIRSCTRPLLAMALKRHCVVCLDLAIDLLVLPLSYFALVVALLIGGSAMALPWWPGVLPWLWTGLSCFAVLLVYVLRGWQLSGLGARGLLDLCGAPLFVLWKLPLMLRRHDLVEWVRTERERP